MLHICLKILRDFFFPCKIGCAKIIDLGTIIFKIISALIKFFFLKFGGFRVLSLGFCILSSQMSFCLWSWMLRNREFRY